MKRRMLLGAVPGLMVLPGCSQGGAGGNSAQVAESAAGKEPDPVKRLQTFGLQLSTITPLLMADFEGGLRKVAEIGYRQVESSALGFLGRPVVLVADLLAAIRCCNGRCNTVGLTQCPRVRNRTASRWR